MKDFGTYYGAVRMGEDKWEFILAAEISQLKSLSQRKADRQDKKLPGFTEENPVQRIATLKIQEVENE